MVAMMVHMRALDLGSALHVETVGVLPCEISADTLRVRLIRCSTLTTAAALFIIIIMWFRMMFVRAWWRRFDRKKRTERNDDGVGLERAQEHERNFIVSFKQKKPTHMYRTDDYYFHTRKDIDHHEAKHAEYVHNMQEVVAYDRENKAAYFRWLAVNQRAKFTGALRRPRPKTTPSHQAYSRAATDAAGSIGHPEA